MKKFLRDKDWLGTWPKMTYKSSPVFGTSIGGFCSMTVNILMGLYIGVILIGFVTQVDYNL